jgi:hypothetical protein
MRSKLLGVILGLGIAAASFAPALACMYNNTAVDSGQVPPQTAQTDTQAQAPAASGAN